MVVWSLTRLPGDCHQHDYDDDDDYDQHVVDQYVDDDIYDKAILRGLIFATHAKH